MTIDDDDDDDDDDDVTTTLVLTVVVRSDQYEFSDLGNVDRNPCDVNCPHRRHRPLHHTRHQNDQTQETTHRGSTIW